MQHWPETRRKLSPGRVRGRGYSQNHRDAAGTSEGSTQRAVNANDLAAGRAAAVRRRPDLASPARLACDRGRRDGGLGNYGLPARTASAKIQRNRPGARRRRPSRTTRRTALLGPSERASHWQFARRFSSTSRARSAGAGTPVPRPRSSGSEAPGRPAPAQGDADPPPTPGHPQDRPHLTSGPMLWDGGPRPEHGPAATSGIHHPDCTTDQPPAGRNPAWAPGLAGPGCPSTPLPAIGSTHGPAQVSVAAFQRPLGCRLAAASGPGRDLRMLGDEGGQRLTGLSNAPLIFASFRAAHGSA